MASTLRVLDVYPILQVQTAMCPRSERTEYIIKKVNKQRGEELLSGYEGLAQHMRTYPVLSPQETDSAIRAYKRGASVPELSRIAPFQERLATEEAQRVFPKNSSPRPSYQLLFTEKRSDGEPVTIPDLVALGHHDLLLRWIGAYHQMFRDLALPLDEFYNKALADLLPHEARTYNPDIAPESFRSWASRMLFWRLQNLAERRAREVRSLPAEMKASKTAVFKDTNRSAILSLESTSVLETGNQEAARYADTLADPSQETDTTITTRSAVKHLFALAGLTREEEAALVTVGIYDYTNAEAGRAMRRNERTVRYYKKQAIAKITAIGDEPTIQAVLRGEGEEIFPKAGPAKKLEPEKAERSRAK